MTLFYVFIKILPSQQNFLYIKSFDVVAWNLQEEREAYEVIVEGGRLVYRQSKDLVHTTEDSKWIFVLSTSRILYVGQKKKGHFQHSSFLAGGATIASGRLVAQNGVLHVCYMFYTYTPLIISIIILLFCHKMKNSKERYWKTYISCKNKFHLKNVKTKN